MYTKSINLQNKNLKLEMAILNGYFQAPEKYLSADDYKQYFQALTHLPNGLKLTRRTYLSENNLHEPIYSRCFIFPNSSLKIPLIAHIDNDPGIHSCEQINKLLLFHQNISDDDSDDDLEDSDLPLTAEQQEAQRKLQTLFTQKKYRKNYLKIPDKQSLITCKEAITSDHQHCVIKITEAVPSFAIGSCLNSLYLCPPFMRNGKHYNIMHHKGPTLHNFLLFKHHTLTSAQKDTIAACLLTELASLQAKGIVMTDINKHNICIQENSDPLNPYTLSYIDDSEAFQGDNTLRGRGTVGYYAPEFFTRLPLGIKSISNFQTWQESLTKDGTLFKQLKTTYHHHFCFATDTFALGCVLLRDLKLTAACEFYTLAQTMSDFDPLLRPDLTERFSKNLFSGLKA